MQHIARAVIHQQAAIGAHRERMQYRHRSNLANSSSGRSTSIVTSHVTNLSRQKKSTHRHRHLLRHRHLHRLGHLLRHGHLDSRRAEVAVTRSTCEPHARPSHAVFVFCGYFSSLVRTTSWARTMRPSKVFRSLRPLTRHGNDGNSGPWRDEQQHGDIHPLNPHHSCSSCTCVRAPPDAAHLACFFSQASMITPRVLYCSLANPYEHPYGHTPIRRVCG